MATEAYVKQLLELGDECTRLMIDQMIPRAPWSAINFEAGREKLEQSIRVLEQFRRLPVGLLPDRIIEQIIATLQPLQGSLVQMRDFSSKQDNPLAARDRLVEQYGRQADCFLGAALLYNCLSCVLAGRRSDKYNCLSCLLEK